MWSKISLPLLGGGGGGFDGLLVLAASSAGPVTAWVGSRESRSEGLIMGEEEEEKRMRLLLRVFCEEAGKDALFKGEAGEI